MIDLLSFVYLTSNPGTNIEVFLCHKTLISRSFFQAKNTHTQSAI